jgi:FdhE protein
MPDRAGLVAEWREALGRRPALATPLQLWTDLISRWADWELPPLAPLAWSAAACRERWERGVPLLAEASLALAPESVEPLLGPVIERIAGASLERHESLRRLAQAWDRGEIGPASLLPIDEKQGASMVAERFGLPGPLVAMLAVAALRPALTVFLASVRELPDGVWRPAGCPWCGSPAAWSDLQEDGRRRLACHTCAGAWSVPGRRCPFCETWQSGALEQLVARGIEEGYVVDGCRTCRGYIKGIDRRQRRRGHSALVEDWSTPHLDLIAERQGFRRPTAAITHLAG